ncbi:MAG: hypothetical protein LPL00_08890, partial [Alphaproteobacteria bacterium]|nr:hypothetical protein [Alphaproteobacteria bacterium]MDX5369738.1 hypothetical protein [Alphaproteobacteria bacterium]MDX5464362.1 hypothetical protein [Alphaproteobacteria bacterium]
MQGFLVSWLEYFFSPRMQARVRAPGPAIGQAKPEGMKGMDFAFSGEQEQVRETVRRFCEKE